MILGTLLEGSNLSSGSTNSLVISDTRLQSIFYDPRLNFFHEFLRATPWGSSTAIAAFTGHKHYALLFAVIYVLSNKLVRHCSNPGHKLFYELDLIFANIPHEYIEKLLHERLSSVKAVFESFILFSAYCSQPKAFSFLVNLGARFGWLDDYTNGHNLLYYAVSLGVRQPLQTLLDNKCRPDLKAASIPDTPFQSISFPTTAIVEALRQRNLRFAQQLIGRCDVNKTMVPCGSTNFDHFLAHSDEYDDVFEKGLILFLEKGLDVDRTEIWSPMTGPGTSIDEACMKSKLDFSILDYLFYFHRPSFQPASLQSNHVRDGHLSRTGVLLSLEGGPQGLQEYLDRLTQRIDQKQLANFLHQLIVEQFLKADLRGRKKVTDLSAVRGLVSSGARIEQVLSLVPNILAFFATLVGGDFNSSEMEAAQYLIENGATVGGHALSWLAGLPDTRLLELARDKVGGQKDWISGLLIAAARNDLKAVERLLPNIVDLHIELQHGNFGTLSLIACVILIWEADFQYLPQMLRVLAEHGAPLRLSARKPHWHHLLLFTLRPHWDWDPDISGTAQYIIDTGYNSWNPSFVSERLLEACLKYGRLETFDYLLRKGARLPVNFPVARLIGLGLEIGLVRERLDAGADVDAYAYTERFGFFRTALQNAASCWRVDIIELLLQKGADVNAPAKGPYGVTALQASCARRAKTSQEEQRQKKTISLLLDSGADINAPPARIGGMTALQRAAENGDFAAQEMLFPGADVNAPPCQLRYHKDRVAPVDTGTALDRAAENGRLDMVHFLLNWNAVSHHRGDTGYDGAIQVAEMRGHHMVAELIRQHAVDNDKLEMDNRNPYLAQPPRDWREYGYEQRPDDDSASEYQDSETDSFRSSDLESEKDPVANYNDAYTSSVALGDDAHDMTQFFPQEEPPAAAAAFTGDWEDRRPRLLEQGDFVTAVEGQPLIGQERGSNSHLNSGIAMDMDTDFGSELRWDSLDQYGDPSHLDDMVMDE